MNKKIIYLLLISFILAATGYFFRQQQKQRTAWQILEKEVARAANNFRGSCGIIIKDLNTNWQIGVNADKLFPSASLLKIPIMLACFSAADENKIKLDELLELKAKDRVGGSGKLKDMPRGSQFTVAELIKLMILESDNIAANMLIERLGFDYLNSYFRKITLKDTNISRKMMDFQGRRRGQENFTTAAELAFILEGIYRGKLINQFYSRRALELLKAQKINDRIPARLPAYAEVAHKTGLERGICHDAGIIFTRRGSILICVLTRHNNKTARSTKDFIAHLALLSYNYKNRGS